MMAAAPYFTKAALILDHLNFMLFTTLTMVAAHFLGALRRFRPGRGHEGQRAAGQHGLVVELGQRVVAAA